MAFIDLRQFENFKENYFNISDILASQERVLCIFDTSILNMGYLNPSSDSEHILPGTKLELPLWLAKSLCSRNRKSAFVEIPKQYNSAYREILSADASVVNLHKLGPYYYRLGLQFLHFNHIESPNISKSLLQTFQARLRKIMDSSLNATEKESNLLNENLDETEKLLFHFGQKSKADFYSWESREIEKMSSSTMILNNKKRKRFQMNDK